jgi:hypothetical protein
MWSKELGLRLLRIVGIGTLVVVGVWQLNPWIFVGLGLWGAYMQTRRAPA